MKHRSSANQKRFREVIARSKAACHICGEPIDYKLRTPDPKSFVIDHLIPLHRGGADALSNVRAAHRRPRLQQHEAHARLRSDRQTVRVSRLRAARTSVATLAGPDRSPWLEGIRLVPETTCAEPGCGLTIVSKTKPRTWCDVHRRLARLRSNAASLLRVVTTCTRSDCTAPVYALGVCRTHWRQTRRAQGLDRHSAPSDSWTPRRRAQWKKRHAIHRGSDPARAEIIYPEAIYARDQWTCQLCGEPVDKTLVFPNPMSPSLDHRVPIAAGGTHTRDNTQLSHFVCNARKGSRTTSDLLR